MPLNLESNCKPCHNISHYVMNPRLWTASAIVFFFGTVTVIVPSDGFAASVAKRYIDAQLKVVHSLQENLSSLAAAADESATRFVAGGTFYLTGEPGMVAEVHSRAGGPCGAKSLDLEKPLPAISHNDVILLSDYGSPGKLANALGRLQSTGAQIVVFVSKEHPLQRQPKPENVRFVLVDIPLESYVLELPGGTKLLPAVSPAIATAQWTYIAELLGACRRQNKQLAIYLSTFLDPGHVRYNRTKGLLFEPDLKPDPVPREQYAREFLGLVKRSLEAIRSGELDKIEKAAAWLRNSTEAHKRVVRSLMGHLAPIEAGSRGDVSFFTHTVLLTGEKGENWIRGNIGDGDTILFLAYRDEDVLSKTASTLGAKTIAITSAGPGTEQARDPRHLYINPQWPITDGCLELSGYDVKACPLSTILNMTCYFAICGEVAAPGNRSRQY